MTFSDRSVSINLFLCHFILKRPDNDDEKMKILMTMMTTIDDDDNDDIDDK